MPITLTNMLTNQMWKLPDTYGGVIFMGAYPPGLYKIANGLPGGVTARVPVRNGSQVQMVQVPNGQSIVYSSNENLRSWLQVGVDWAASGVANFEALSAPPPDVPPPGEGPSPPDEGGPPPDEGGEAETLPELPPEEEVEEEPDRGSANMPSRAELLARARARRRRAQNER